MTQHAYRSLAAASPSGHAAVARRDSKVRRDAGPTARGPDHLAESELLETMQAYRRSSGRLFPTWSEALEVLRSLRFEKSVD